MSLSIGQASELSGVPAKTIRYYEESGLLARPERARNGYRSYRQRDVHILRFVKRARDLGFSMEQVSELVSLWNDRTRKSRDVKKVAQVHLSRVQDKLDELRSLERTLQNLVRNCHGNDSPDCPILEELAREKSLGDNVR